MDSWLCGGTRCFTSSPCRARQAALAALAALAADGAGTCSSPHSGIAWPRALVLPQKPIMGKLHSKSVIFNYLLCGRLLMWQAQQCVMRQFHRPLM